MKMVGTTPRLPRLLREWEWFNRPVAVERLTALRIAVGIVILLDLLLTWMPVWWRITDADGWAARQVFAESFAAPRWTWSIFRVSAAPWWPHLILVIWVVSVFGMMVSRRAQWFAVVAWVISVSFFNSMGYLNNGGDRLRNILLFYLMLSPVGRGIRGFTHPWALRLLMIQLVLIYFTNGIWKLTSAEWRDGSILQIVMHNPAWSMLPQSLLPDVAWPYRIGTWVTLVWEIGFPLWMWLKVTRVPALCLGIVFHLTTLFVLEVGAFPLYSLCFYVPLFPWERLRHTSPIADSSSPSS